MTSLVEDNRIRPATYGLAFYFLVMATDCFALGSVGSILKLIALIPLGLSLLDVGKMRIRINAAIVFQLLFWLLAVVSILYSINSNKTFVLVRTLSLNVILVIFLGAMQRYNQRELQYMQRALLLSGWLTILLMLMFSNISNGGRLTLVLGESSQDQNYINGYFLYTFSWHSSKVLLEKKKIHILPTIFLLSVLLLTGSRGALLAFVAVLFVHICISFMHTKHTVRNIALVVLLIIVLSVSFDLILTQMPEDVAERFSWDYIDEKGTTGRTRIWIFLLEHFSGDSILRMLFGHGYGTVRIITMHDKVAHNLYLDNLITLGIAGVVLQIATQGAIVAILFKYRQYPLLSAYIGMLIMCLSLSLLDYKPIWNIMILALAMDFYKKSENKSESQKQTVLLL